MPYIPYATERYYESNYGGNLISEDSLRRFLMQASRHIDTLTYNRIVGQGFDNLTEFQKNVIQEVVCRQAEFEYENADEISTSFSHTTVYV